MQRSQQITQDLVLIGGGHSHAIVLRMLGMKPLPGIRVTLITEASDTPYSGMLPGHVAGFYTHEECHIDLRRLAQFAQVQFYRDRLVGLDLANKKVICANQLILAALRLKSPYLVQQNMRFRRNQWRNFSSIGMDCVKKLPQQIPPTSLIKEGFCAWEL
jgi:NADH dehydrogenase FAD-containing subunit